MKYTRCNSQGDTLIEVTLALAILAMVLVSTYAVATRAYKLGQDAQIRRQVSALMVEQAEQLRNLRDNSTTWSAFLDTVHVVSVGAPTTTFHLETHSTNAVPNVPAFYGSKYAGVGGSMIYIVGICNSPYSSGGGDVRGDSCSFTIRGDWPSSYSINNTASMDYWLVNDKILRPPS